MLISKMRTCFCDKKLPKEFQAKFYLFNLYTRGENLCFHQVFCNNLFSKHFVTFLSLHFEIIFKFVIFYTCHDLFQEKKNQPYSEASKQSSREKHGILIQSHFRLNTLQEVPDGKPKNFTPIWGVQNSRRGEALWSVAPTMYDKVLLIL